MAEEETTDIVEEAPCFFCFWLFDYPYCSAFPDGIPDDIRSGMNRHTSEYPGDRGFRFIPLELDPDREEE